MKVRSTPVHGSSCCCFAPTSSSFLSGGIRCRSRFCPVRMYNKDKPDKFRVDFFILAGSESYIIHHLDVYQGKNASNVSVHESCWNLPTTMKAVVNAVIQASLSKGSNDVNGYRCISLDNRYQCPQLAFLLWTRYVTTHTFGIAFQLCPYLVSATSNSFRILTTGTCRTNRKGWPKDIMTLLKTAGRGTYKIAICRHYNLMAVQWCDSRVVNNVSSYMNFDVGQVRRRVGRIRQVVECPQVLIHYQSHMGGVDRGDQKRGHFGAFASYAHFKKWYKKTIMALLDCSMMMNAHIMWNMSLESDAAKAMGRKKLERWEFMQVLAYELQTYETPSLKSPPRGSAEMQDESRMETDPVTCEAVTANRVVDFPDRRGRRCVVCQVEEPIIKACIREYKHANPNAVAECDVPKLVASMIKGNRKRLTACKCCFKEQGGLSSHNFVFGPNERKSIHSLFPEDMTCRDILHSDVGRELWKRNARSSSDGKRMRVSTGHHYMTDLKKLLMEKVIRAFE